MTDSSFIVDDSYLGDPEAIEARLGSLPEVDEATRLAFGYLYLDDGPKSVPRSMKAAAEKHLSPVELYIFQWLNKRTDGKLRRLYGPAALAAAKRSRYRCERCDYADVRALNLEKRKDVAEDGDQPQFICLCANCNTVAARAAEMVVVASDRASRLAKAEEERLAALAAENVEVSVATPEAQSDSQAGPEPESQADPLTAEPVAEPVAEPAAEAAATPAPTQTQTQSDASVEVAMVEETESDASPDASTTD